MGEQLRMALTESDPGDEDVAAGIDFITRLLLASIINCYLLMKKKKDKSHNFTKVLLPKNIFDYTFYSSDSVCNLDSIL